MILTDDENTTSGSPNDYEEINFGTENSNLFIKGSYIENTPPFYGSYPRRVLVFGDFDFLHPGHLYYFQIGKMMGTHLTVAVSTDEFYETMKHRKPFLPMADRVNMIRQIIPVDMVTSYAGNYQETVEKHQSDLVLLLTEHQGKDRFNEIQVPILYLPRLERYSCTNVRDLLKEFETAKSSIPTWHEIWQTQNDYPISWGGNFETLADYIRKQCDVPLRILDFGCGTAEYWTYFTRYGIEMYGIDISPLLLVQAIRNNPGIPSDHFHRPVLHQLTLFEDPKHPRMDLCMVHGVFHYLSHKEASDLITLMKQTADRIFITDIPHESSRVEREKVRKPHYGEIIPHEYYSEESFEPYGFVIKHHDFISNNYDDQSLYFDAYWENPDHETHATNDQKSA